MSGAVEGSGGYSGQSHRRLTALYNSYGAETAAITEARNMAKRKGPQPTGAGQGPTSLFIFSDDNFIRRHTRFIIEWPYLFYIYITITFQFLFLSISLSANSKVFSILLLFLLLIALLNITLISILRLINSIYHHFYSTLI